MLLKTLSLAGFKSFADRTRLEFDGGVNVVVGPNGSGKSNLLDALAWVMGTQATSALRTQRMEDVIFAGTDTRPALGRAEVTLTFDNRDRFLPVDLDDVAMTRRLYRDGTSEYELNGTPCRLMDLHELLSDGGVGRHQHVLVGQGQIGEILNARPEEHRAVIEEAAGITKHRGRRDRSLRRLERTDVDVARLTDILDQQRKRLRPLKRQANAAMRHDSVKAEARALRLWLGGEALRHIRGRLETAGAERAELERTVADAQRHLEAVVESLATLEDAAGETGRALQRDTAAAARLETVAERLHRIAMVARERRAALESRLLGASERRSDVAAELEHLTDQIATSQVEEEEARAAAERREATLQALEDEERSLAEQLALPAEGVVANLRGDLRALEAADERDRREREAMLHRRDVVVSRLESDEAEAGDVGRSIEVTDAEVDAASKRYSTTVTTRERAQETLEAAEAELQACRIAAAQGEARVSALETALDGLGDPEARSQAAAADGARGLLVSALDVPEDLAAAVDAALGAWREAIVVADDAALDAITSDLKAGGFGGVTLAPIVDDGHAAANDARTAAQAWGLELLADRLGPAAHRSVALHWLGDVVLAEGWTTARAFVAKHPTLRVVTPEGDLVAAAGIRVAEPDGAGPAALEAARVALEIAERDVSRTETVHRTARRDFDQARDAEREALEALEQLEARLTGYTEALAMLDRSRSAGHAELSRLDSRLDALTEAAATRAERIGELRSRVAEFEGEEQARQQAWEALNRRRDEVARRRDRARRDRQEAAAALAGVTERRRLASGRLEATRRELDELESMPVDPAEIARLGEIEASARAGTDVVRGHVETLRERQRDLRARAGVADERLADAHHRQRELERSISDGKERMSTLAVELAELRVRDETTAEGLRRDVDASEEQALDAPRPELDEDVDPQNRLGSLEADLRRMGPINPLAAAEYAELSAEVEHLEGQLADLDESRRELRKVITALDEEMAALFLEAFDDIARLYEENFGLVFPGGRGRLLLTDRDDPLGSGVEITAQPLGKRVSRLSLLSGGERSLAALAFLFAVFRARPSPFYVLDEVEAALDDANLRRFLRLVATLRESAQLVIITHQPQTMEAADILYGVTMEPGASSQVVAKRLAAVTVE